MSLLPDQRPLNAAAWLLLLIGGFWILIIGKTLIVPLVLAGLAVYLIEIIKRQILKVRVAGHRAPRWLALTLAIGTIVGCLWTAAWITATNASRVVAAAPQYEKRAHELSLDLRHRLRNWVPEALQTSPESGSPEEADAAPDDLDERPGPFSWITDQLNVSATLSTAAAGVASMLGNASLILVYMFFLLLEAPYAHTKLLGLIPDPDRRSRCVDVMETVDRDIQVYLGVKSFVSLLTALGSYIIMRFVGLDFPEFFALLIFCFNFIPNIGSLIATLVPTLLALFQFDTYSPFLIVAVGVTAVQLIVANFIEPPLMGRSLNMSPLVVIISLVFWGKIWGIAGMFLCVPLTVIGMIIVAQNPRLRWIAVLLSQDGEPKQIHEPENAST